MKQVYYQENVNSHMINLIKKANCFEKEEAIIKGVGTRSGWTRLKIEKKCGWKKPAYYKNENLDGLMNDLGAGSIDELAGKEVIVYTHRDLLYGLSALDEE